MKKRLTLLPLLVLFCLPCAAQKKVYADYHGVRYTRAHDGMLGRWGLYTGTGNSSTGVGSICYNADLVLPDGTRQIAAVDYPMAGMQSNLDPDFIEYQILTAKAAGIDGFWIEWGFMPHENHTLLEAMLQAGKRYGFEIGVNWCDQWLYYDWIELIHPHIDSRARKTEYFTQCYQWLVDNVLYGVPTAPVVAGRPVFYLFGPGATVQEYTQAGAGVRFPAGQPRPAVLRRWADWGKIDDRGGYEPVRYSADVSQWSAAGTIPTAWLPARVRERDADHSLWDNYGTAEDAVEFMAPFRDSVWMSPDPAYTVKSGFVMPGMDNRGCAGWGRGHFYLIPREEGETYRRMWEFNLASKDSLDMVFIASWSDYTEGHEIEPTVCRGYRELKTTLEYASQFKGTEADYSGMELPLRLFRARKDLNFLWNCSISLSKASLSAPDGIAMQISRGEYAAAMAALDVLDKELAGYWKQVKTEKVTLPGGKLDVAQGPPVKVSIPPSLIRKLTAGHYRGYLTFSYLDEGTGELWVTSYTDRTPAKEFGTICRLYLCNTGEWKQARVELFPENVALAEGRSLLQFGSKARVKDISLEYEIFRK